VTTISEISCGENYGIQYLSHCRASLQWEAHKSTTKQIKRGYNIMKMKDIVIAATLVGLSSSVMAAEGSFLSRIGFGGDSSKSEAKAEANVSVDTNIDEKAAAAKAKAEAKGEAMKADAEQKKAEAQAKRDEMKAKAEAEKAEREAAKAERDAKAKADAEARAQERAEAKAKAEASMEEKKAALRSLTNIKINANVEAGADAQ
jgi:hypothetical protein